MTTARPDIEKGLRSTSNARQRADRLLWLRQEREKRTTTVSGELDRAKSYLGISSAVTAALETLNQQLFQQLLSVVQEKLTIALHEVLDQPIRFHADVDFKRGSSAVEFWVERDGNKEDAYRGQGGSVANVLSVGLRMFALTTLDETEHRRFLVLDEQDCWLRPDLVPKLVKIVHDAGHALGFQVLMISHHDVSTFERYADKIYELFPSAERGLEVRLASVPPCIRDLIENENAGDD
jgi:ABC-type glutathione transport system ATPase component